MTENNKMEQHESHSKTVTTNVRQLVRAYQEVLRTLADQLPFGVPETLLPAKKDIIRRALKKLATSASPSGWSGPTLVSELRSAYVALANFISNAEAQEAMRLHQALSRGDRSFLDSDVTARVTARARRIEQEATQLGAEFDHLISDRDASNLLAEIDTFLTEFKSTTPASKRSKQNDLDSDWVDIFTT
jgi:hypothetical protein